MENMESKLSVQVRMLKLIKPGFYLVLANLNYWKLTLTWALALSVPPSRIKEHSRTVHYKIMLLRQVKLQRKRRFVSSIELAVRDWSENGDFHGEELEGLKNKYAISKKRIDLASIFIVKSLASSCGEYEEKPERVKN